MIYQNDKIKAATTIVLFLFGCFSSEHLLYSKNIDDLEHFVQTMIPSLFLNQIVQRQIPPKCSYYQTIDMNSVQWSLILVVP